jgi:L-gulonate 5-dehydrogenase
LTVAAYTWTGSGMLAAVTSRAGRMSLEWIPEPRPGPGEALVRVAAVGLCGSDSSFFRGLHPYANFPQVQGHEVSGYVESLPDDYRGPLAVGDLVAVEPLLPCGSCFPCRRGRYNCCTQLAIIGIHVPGGLAEWLVAPVHRLLAADDLTPEAACLVEPASIAVQAASRAQVLEGDQALVVGAGPIGMLTTLALVDRGAQVLVADRSEERLDYALTMGASEICVVDGPQALSASVASWTGDQGVALAVDATGDPAVVRECVSLLAPSGSLVVVGVSKQDVSLPLVELTRKELTILGSRNNAFKFDQALALLQNNVDAVTGMISHRFRLADVESAMHLSTTPGSPALKIVVCPDAMPTTGS